MERGQLTPLRVLIMSQTHTLERILASNVQNWGYEAIVVSSPFLTEERSRNAASAMHSFYSENEETGGGPVEQEEVADVLLYDLDRAFQEIQIGKDSPFLGHASFETKLYKDQSIWPCIRYSGPRRLPKVRASIVFSNRSVARATLDQLGAIAVLQKPFEMGRLQRYLRVLQRVLCTGADEDGQRESYTPGKNRRILVVDDNVEVAYVVRQCLMEGSIEHEYDVHVAHDGLEALEQCLHWHPHCIVTDLIMPWMNGYQVMRCLAAGSSSMTPAFVVVSALASFERSKKHSYLHGRPIAYVNKPFQVAQLLQAVEQVCMKYDSDHEQDYRF